MYAGNVQISDGGDGYPPWIFYSLTMVSNNISCTFNRWVHSSCCLAWGLGPIWRKGQADDDYAEDEEQVFRDL